MGSSSLASYRYYHTGLSLLPYRAIIVNGTSGFLRVRESFFFFFWWPLADSLVYRSSGKSCSRWFWWAGAGTTIGFSPSIFLGTARNSEEKDASHCLLSHHWRFQAAPRGGVRLDLCSFTLGVIIDIRDTITLGAFRKVAITPTIATIIRERIIIIWCIIIHPLYLDIFGKYYYG